ncbi:hypothetical protein KTN05_01140 [Paracoccus sp. Z118]|uniref:hypothetical protein n=1 Tax=Paracoccus sp. Z118 TaxID=2851017 RepID=UPI001C2C085A|nr:hypothetical protein [Paracoccus sp. Z118]MBV0890455.1 hypothetical protein [Paracoccus sp. Z118]
MPKLVRLYIVNVALGFLLAVIFTALLIGLNVANLRHLVMSSNGGFVAVFMLLVFHTALFAGVQFAIAVMRMAEPSRPPRGGLRAPLIRRQPAPVPVLAKAAAKR